MGYVVASDPEKAKFRDRSIMISRQGVACLRFIIAGLKKPVGFAAVTRPSCIAMVTVTTADEIPEVRK